MKSFTGVRPILLFVLLLSQTETYAAIKCEGLLQTESTHRSHDLIVSESFQNDFELLTTKVYSNGVYVKRGHEKNPYRTIDREIYIYPSPAELNALYRFGEDSPLHFIAGSGGHNREYEVSTEVYVRALSRGQIIISSKHDIETHVAGYARLASSPQWLRLREILRQSYEIIDDPTSTSAQIQLAKLQTRQISDALEIGTGRMTWADERAKSAINNFNQHAQDLGMSQKDYLHTATGKQDLDKIKSAFSRREREVKDFDNVIDNSALFGQ